MFSIQSTLHTSPPPAIRTASETERYISRNANDSAFEPDSCARNRRRTSLAALGGLLAVPLPDGRMRIPAPAPEVPARPSSLLRRIRRINDRSGKTIRRATKTSLFVVRWGRRYVLRREKTSVYVTVVTLGRSLRALSRDCSRVRIRGIDGVA